MSKTQFSSEWVYKDTRIVTNMDVGSDWPADLSCLCLEARARCSSSMMQLGGSCWCIVARWGDPVGVEILPLIREPWGSLGRVKFLGKVAGDFLTETGGAAGAETSPHSDFKVTDGVHSRAPRQLTIKAAQSGEQFDWKVWQRRGAGSSLWLGHRHLLPSSLAILCLRHGLLLAVVTNADAFLLSFCTLAVITPWVDILSHILNWNERGKILGLCLHLVDK